ncbi:MAG: DMT family transporter [Hyphomicrobiales bacterium]
MPPSVALSARKPMHWYVLGILVILWGSSFAASKIAVETISPIWVVSLRITIGALLMLLYLFYRKQNLSRKLTDWIWFFWLGLVGNVLPFTLISWGVRYVPSGVAGILMAAVPLCVIVLAHFLLSDEHLTRQKASGFLIGFLGVAILVGVGGGMALDAGPIQLWALLAITAAALCYALNGTTARLMPDMTNASKSAGVLIAAAATSLPMSLIIAPNGLSEVSLASVFAVVVLGVFPTALATILLYKLLKEAGASFLALSNYLVPVFAVMVGVILLGEALQWSDWLGLALVLCGILISERRRNRS